MFAANIPAEDTRQSQWEHHAQRAPTSEVIEGYCISGLQREPGSDDRQQVAARCLRALRTTIEEPGVQAKRGKAFKRRWLVLIPEASCCHVEETGGSWMASGDRRKDDP